MWGLRNSMWADGPAIQLGPLSLDHGLTATWSGSYVTCYTMKILSWLWHPGCKRLIFTLRSCFPQLPRLEATVWNSGKTTLSLLEMATFLLIALLTYGTHYLTISSLHQRSCVLKNRQTTSQLLPVMLLLCDAIVLLFLFSSFYRSHVSAGLSCLCVLLRRSFSLLFASSCCTMCVK